jgi:hypothetical protein
MKRCDTCLICGRRFRATSEAEEICNSDDCASRNEAIQAAIIAARETDGRHPMKKEEID